MLEINVFSFKEFMKELEDSDLCGLEYLENTLIKTMVEKNKNNHTDDFTSEEYITSLFYATKELNNCNFIYECTNVNNKFNADLYFDLKGLLIREIKDFIVENGVFNYE